MHGVTRVGVFCREKRQTRDMFQLLSIHYRSWRYLRAQITIAHFAPFAAKAAPMITYNRLCIE